MTHRCHQAKATLEDIGIGQATWRDLLPASTIVPFCDEFLGIQSIDSIKALVTPTFKVVAAYDV